MDRRESLLNIRIVALYPLRIDTLAGCPGVRFRQRKGRRGTVVPCRVEPLDGRSVAQPEYLIPDGTPAPSFRAQFETARVSVDERSVLCVVLSAEPAASDSDPEHLLLSPIFDDGHRMIFEFRRAQILSVTRRGQIETRLVAVDSVRGIVGTKTIHRFDRRLLGLAARCAEHLSGQIDLFPAPGTVPVGTTPCRCLRGEANLAFGGRSTGTIEAIRNR